MFTARYDLRRRTASFDFFTWMLHNKLLGASKIVFGMKMPENSKWRNDEIKRRFHSIVEPGPQFANLPCREARPGEGEESGNHRINQLADLVKKNPYCDWRLRSLFKYDKRFTVTLRTSDKKPHRNSDDAVWRKFAAEIDAHIIEDYDVKPIGLVDRMALYAGADMNFGVVNGPMAILFYTEYPVMMCDCITDEDHMRKHGMPEGSQHPLALHGQTLVWEKPTVENLMQRYEEAGF